MYNRDDIERNFSGLIGFRPSYDNREKLRIDDDLYDSISGQYINDIHELFKLENFVNTLDRYTTFTVVPYNASKSYRKGEVVSYDDKIWQCLVAGSGGILTPNHWRETTLLSVWIRNKYISAIYKTLDAIIEYKRSNSLGRILKDVSPLYMGDGIKANAIEKSGRFVGYKIFVKHSDTSIVLQRMGLQLTGAATVPIYLYHSSSNIAIATWDFEAQTPNRFGYGDMQGSYSLSTIEGYYVVGYYEEDLPADVKAIKLVSNAFEVSTGCSGCGGGSTWSRYMMVHPFSVESDNLSGEEMVWSNEEMVFDYSNNWGLNLSMSFRCDFTRLFVKERDSFIPAIIARIRIEFLEALANSVRDNQKGDEIATLAYHEVKNFTSEESPVISFRRAIKALNYEFSGINDMCLPEDPTGQIRYDVT